ncbi:hypothetical protein CPC08DRAFT_745274 [Agrocybe pediades]|nr:hypothetical protein CPC08DRAFT_745274 [Agrocybe pediades]
MSGSVVRRIMREMKELQTSPPEGIRVQSNDQDILDVTGIIEGPEGTPYQGGYFRVKFKFTDEFPAAPPKCWFATKIFHPNVGPTGEICVNTLKKDWKPTYGIGHILVTVKCLLIYPNPESALDEEAGKLLLEEYQAYCDRAKLITSVHATPRVKPVEFDTPSASEVEEAKAKDAPTPSTSSSQASTSKTTPKTSAPSTPAPVATVTSPTIPTSMSENAGLSIPTITRKSVSPAPPSLKSSVVKEVGNGKERHPSPSPLGTADSNVGGGKPGMGVGLGMASTTTLGGAPGTKAVKRSATGSAPTGAEKRKKALKRL